MRSFTSCSTIPRCNTYSASFLFFLKPSSIQWNKAIRIYVQARRRSSVDLSRFYLIGGNRHRPSTWFGRGFALFFLLSWTHTCISTRMLDGSLTSCLDMYPFLHSPFSFMSMEVDFSEFRVRRCWSLIRLDTYIPLQFLCLAFLLLSSIRGLSCLTRD
jgi:hypothetical protein